MWTIRSVTLDVNLNRYRVALQRADDLGTSPFTILVRPINLTAAMPGMAPDHMVGREWPWVNHAGMPLDFQPGREETQTDESAVDAPDPLDPVYAPIEPETTRRNNIIHNVCARCGLEGHKEALDVCSIHYTCEAHHTTEIEGPTCFVQQSPSASPLQESVIIPTPASSNRRVIRESSINWIPVQTETAGDLSFGRIVR